MRSVIVAVALAALLSPVVSPAFAQNPQPYDPRIEPASAEGRNAIGKFEVPGDLQVSLAAAEPHLANPVIFWVDARGRFYVAETFRHHQGVTDNRNQAHHADWLEQELACRTVEDRVAMYRRVFGEGIADYETAHERIRLLEDTDNDGEVDRATVFADGFHDIADGIGAGLLEYRGDVFYTCIPKLWRLRDRDGDGRADERTALHHGFGVHTALLGHDMHGLIIGPDGRLYFSIGDRGLHVETPQGTLALPDEGAVLRCDLDGGNLEVFARGLRNPQELAFDQFGNLFTGDNNSDGGDRARWVYLVEGGTSGWQCAYQSIPDRGPWNREKLWHPAFAGQAAYIVPPVANIADGPSGLVYDPGTGLPERYRDRFLLCDFRGSSANSGVRVIGVSPKGAGFELTHSGKLIWRVLATDVAIGADGNVYLTDWTEGWDQPRKGRIYRVAASQRDPRADATRQALTSDFDRREVGTLRALLADPDMRVRQAAQFALAARGADSLPALLEVVGSPDHRLARVHGIWALDQIARAASADGRESALSALRGLIDDDDAEIRAQAAKALGDNRADAGEALTRLLRDPSSRVRAFAAHALGKIRFAPALVPLLEMLEANADRDPFLRHAGVMGLAGLDDVRELLQRVEGRERAARLGVVLALRRLQHAGIARFLDDADALVVLEAGRAIHDVPIPAALPALATIVGRSVDDDALMRRAINANYRLGTPEAIARLVAFAAREGGNVALRVEALSTLAAWAEPSNRDRVLNLWRPLEPRDAGPARTALEPELAALLANAPDQLRGAAAEAAAKLGVRSVAPALADVVGQRQRTDEARTSALRALLTLDENRAKTAMVVAAADESAAVRRVAVQMLAKLDPAAAVPVLERLADEAPTGERQNALRSLGGIDLPQAEAALSRKLDALIAGDTDAAVQLDLLEAATARGGAVLNDRLARFEASLSQADVLAPFRVALEGGDQRAGSRVFYEHVAASCRKCHRVKGDGADIGPDLTDVGRRLTRAQILESLIAPNAEVTAGFGSVVATMNDETVHAGILAEAGETIVKLITGDGSVLMLQRTAIATLSTPVSSMPPMGTVLTRRELRDLVQFLTTLTSEEPR